MRTVSKSPSPYMKPRSLMGTTAWAAGTNWPLRKTIMGLNSWQPFNYLKYCDFASRKIPMAKSSCACRHGHHLPWHGQLERVPNARRLCQGFLVFRFGIRVCHDAGANAEKHLPVFANRRADGDA